MAEGTNKEGGLTGLGPVWGCSQFGRTDHNYNDCPECLKRFNDRMEELRRGIDND